ncbi:MAG: calcium/sodium antiporter, partial [Rhodospirillaceae bacterium]|nr:calcium/sodium antiporter [Rhodospirillaceae bacterium]
EGMSLTRAAVFAVGGVICLVAGADAFVWSGAELARSYGWSEDVIGLTIVAVGTSLPEIISLLASLQHRRHDVALGSVVGSNLFNFTLVLGTAGLSGELPVSDLSGQFMMPILIALTAILVVCSTLNYPLGRRSGFVFVGFYLAFLSLNLNMYNA